MSRKKRDENVALVIVYGMDKTGTLRAGWITKKKFGAVRRAASKMSMQRFVVRGLIAEYVVGRIAAARLDPTKTLHIREVSKAVFNEIVQLALIIDPRRRLMPKLGADYLRLTQSLKPDELQELERQIVDIANERRLSRLPSGWNTIEKGSLVIANRRLGRGWWEATVIERIGDMLFLRWREHPDRPPSVRHRSTVALIAPHAT